MEILTAVVVGVVAGILMKAVFLKESSLAWDAALGAVGGVVAYFLSTSLSATVYGYVALAGVALAIAGLLYGLTGRFGKTV
ncbi:MAG: hypothetical protein M3164_03285 [Actinomycetota bacterium]|nr:hypothetical protein [Actinomycetota bacterium]